MSSSYISYSLRFVDGPRAGKHIMVRLAESQKADVGRKCGIHDRRTLDPPPVVRLRIYDVRDPGAAIFREKEITNPSEVDSHGWMCHVDLFPVPLSMEDSSPMVCDDSTPLRTGYTVEPHQHFRTPPSMISSSVDSGPRWSREMNANVAMSDSALRDPAKLPGPMATYYNGVPVPESSACTSLIVGTTIASPTVLNYQGTKQVLFTFSDIAVREDGDYFLRYRVFNVLYSIAGDVPFPIVAECFGGPFKVYTTKDFPGLRASTELTKRISLSGTRVIAREHERKRRRSMHTEWSPKKSQAAKLAPSAARASTSKEIGDGGMPMTGLGPSHDYEYARPGHKLR